MWTTVKKTLALAALVATLDAANAIKVELTNMCAEEFDLSHLGRGSVISVEKFIPGSTKTKELPMESHSQLFKAGTGSQATLAEITVAGGKLWLDISIIPTGSVGPGSCSTFEQCKRITGGNSYNLPMQIIPSTGSSLRFPTCQTITCMSDGCPEAYLFPSDDTKTKVCPGTTDVKVIFCPGGPGGKTPAPTTPTPTTPAPTTPAPTTPAPTTPAPSTPAPAATENSALSTEGGGFLGGSAAGNATSEDRSLDAGAPTPPPTVAPVAAPASPASAPAAATVIGAPEVAVQEANNKSGNDNSGGGTGLYVMLSVGVAAMVAGSAIFVLRKKKQALEALDEKTPLPTTGRATTAFMLTTPQETTVL